jgi:hypothetical protein
MNFKAIAAAVLAVASVSANATIANAGTAGAGDNGELFLAVVNTTGDSYTLDLGVKINDFFAADSLSRSWSVASDANFAAFLAASSSSADLQWAVMATDKVGIGALKTAALTTITEGTLADNNLFYASLPDIAGAIDAYAGIVSSTGTHGGTAGSVAINGSSFNAAGSTKAFQDNATDTAGGILTGSLNAIDITTGLYAFRQPAGGAAGTPVVLYTAPGFLKFGQDKTLTYTVAAVPEPSSYALLSFGLVVAGLMVRRRNGR